MAYVSKEHFCRSFKRYTGMTLTQFLKKIRIREAERLLLETDLIIGEISRRVGYQDEKHFAKLFRSYLGESPAVFRARHRK